MRRPERALPAQSTFTEHPRDAFDHRHLERLGVVQHWQQPGHGSREQGLARAGRSDQHQVVATRDRHFERPAGVALATHLR
jgi:hypothetical protein